MLSKTWTTSLASMATGFCLQHCVFLATTLSALGCTLAGLEKQNDMIFLVAPFLQVFLAMALVTCLAGPYVETAPEPEDLEYTRNIQH